MQDSQQRRRRRTLKTELLKATEQLPTELQAVVVIGVDVGQAGVDSPEPLPPE